MLPLDSSRWKELRTFYRSGAELPEVIADWISAVGTDDERDVYFGELFDLFLHQNTIATASLAVVPWLVQVCLGQETRCRACYLANVAMVEANRLEYGVEWNKSGSEAVPEWLMGDYRSAIIIARNLSEDELDKPQQDYWHEDLRRMKPALFGNASLAWRQWRGE